MAPREATRRRCKAIGMNARAKYGTNGAFRRINQSHMEKRILQRLHQLRADSDERTWGALRREAEILTLDELCREQKERSA
jgi:hypothetical protein